MNHKERAEELAGLTEITPCECGRLPSVNNGIQARAIADALKEAQMEAVATVVEAVEKQCAEPLQDSPYSIREAARQAALSYGVGEEKV